MGIIPSPTDCYQVNRSLKTLAIRMQQHVKNSQIIGQYIEAHPLVEKVLHPGNKMFFIKVFPSTCNFLLEDNKKNNTHKPSPILISAHFYLNRTGLKAIFIYFNKVFNWL